MSIVLKQYPSDRSRLDPLAISSNQCGTPACPLDKVTLILIGGQIF
jgi:hypothetical protein